jgi:hypothetical protein
MTGPFRFDTRTGRYRDASGKFLPAERVRRIIDATLLSHTKAVTALAEQLRQRALSLPEWERRMRQEVKAIHLYSAMAGRGGRQQLTQSDYGRIGREIRRQYTYLRRFADEIQRGAQRLDGTFVNRARLYAQSGRSQFEATRRVGMRERGMTEWRNVLRPAEHCTGSNSCTEASALGWQPIGKGFGLPGSRRCVTSCRCELSYRNPDTGEVAA